MKKIITILALVILSLTSFSQSCNSSTMGITVAQHDTSVWVSQSPTVIVNAPKVSSLQMQIIAYGVDTYTWSNSVVGQSIYYQIPTMNDNMVLLNGMNSFTVTGQATENGNVCYISKVVHINVKNGSNLTGIKDYGTFYRQPSSLSIQYFTIEGKQIENIEQGTLYLKRETFNDGSIKTTKFIYN